MNSADRWVLERHKAGLKMTEAERLHYPMGVPMNPPPTDEDVKAALRAWATSVEENAEISRQYVSYLQRTA